MGDTTAATNNAANNTARTPTGEPVQDDSTYRTAKRALDEFGRGAKTGDFSGFLGMVTDDFTFYMPVGQPAENSGREAITKFLDIFKQVGADLTYQPPFRTTRQGDTVMFEYEDSGTMLDRPYHNVLAVSLDVRGDKIAAYREYWGEINPQLIADLTKS